MKPISSWLFTTVTLLSTFGEVLSEFKLQLLHTNDMHARFQETDAHSGTCQRGNCYGGFARIKTAVDRFRTEGREEGRSTIFLNAGDNYQGTLYYSLFKWKVVSELVNMLGIDVMSLGNHEFDDGPEGLAPFIANSSVPIVCCNIDYSEEPAFQDQENLTRLVPSWVLNLDGVKVGVIGYLTPETQFISKLGGVKLLDEISEIEKEAVRLKGEGVNILIALGHSGYVADKRIAEKVPYLDVVVGGHTNTFLYSGKAPGSEVADGPYPTVVTQASGRKVLVVQAYAYTKYLGQLKLTFDDEGEVVESSGNPVVIDESFQKDGSVERIVLSYGNQIKMSANRRIGSTRSFLEADDRTCRIRECNFGNFVADAMVDANAKDFHGKGWTDAPIAFVQGGSLRTSISTKNNDGWITYADLLTTMPFSNSVEKLTLEGHVLKEALEKSVARYDLIERQGGFLQYSGLKVEYDLSKPPQQRVVSALVRCGQCPVPQYSPLVPHHLYRVLTNSFLADGGDGYIMLLQAKERQILSTSDVDAVETYMNKLAYIYPEVNGRILFKEPIVPADSSTAATFPTFAKYSSVSFPIMSIFTSYLLAS